MVTAVVVLPNTKYVCMYIVLVRIYVCMYEYVCKRGFGYKEGEKEEYNGGYKELVEGRIQKRWRIVGAVTYRDNLKNSLLKTFNVLVVID